MSISATLWTLAHQAPLFMGFSKQEYWRGLLFSTLGDLPDPQYIIFFIVLAEHFNYIRG